MQTQSELTFQSESLSALQKFQPLNFHNKFCFLKFVLTGLLGGLEHLHFYKNWKNLAKFSISSTVFKV